jgi:hypothetical protein
VREDRDIHVRPFLNSLALVAIQVVVGRGLVRRFVYSKRRYKLQLIIDFQDAGVKVSNFYIEQKYLLG